VWIETGYHGASHNGTLEIDVEEDATDDEIEQVKREATMDWAMNKINIGYE
jgi:hypothetical protein